MMKRTKTKQRDEEINSSGFYQLDKDILLHYGLQTAIFLTHLIDVERYFKQQERLKDGMFFQTHKQITESTTLTAYQIRKSKNRLILDEIISTRIDYSGFTRHLEYYAVNHDSLTDLVNKARLKKLKARELKNLRLEGKETKGYNNNIDKKEQKINNSNSVCGDEMKNSSIINSTIGENDIKRKTSNDKITPNDFTEFWKLYPKKVNKKGAQNNWNKLCKQTNRPTWKEIKQSIINQKKTERWQEIQFIKQPAGWLNEERWNDDPSAMIKYKIETKQINAVGSRATGSFKHKYRQPDFID